MPVRETGVSRHQEAPIEGPPETPRTSQHYRIEGLPDLGTKGNGNIVFSVRLTAIRCQKFTLRIFAADEK